MCCLRCQTPDVLQVRARTGTKATITTGAKDTTTTTAMDSKATAMVAMATMTTLLVITAMGVATITVSDKSPPLPGKTENERNFIFLVLVVVQKNSVPFSLVLQTRAIQAMGKLQDVEATRVATSHTDHT